MNYNVKVSCENQARVFNFREDSFSEEMIAKILKGVAKENYTVIVNHGFKRHRGKAMSFHEVVSAVEELRFYVFERRLRTIFEDYYEPIFDMRLPGCSYLSSDLVYWGTFFEIGVYKSSLVKPDMDKIRALFNNNGLDLHLAKNGRYYTHNRIKIEFYRGSDNEELWRVSRILEKELQYWKVEKWEL